MRFALIVLVVCAGATADARPYLGLRGPNIGKRGDDVIPYRVLREGELPQAEIRSFGFYYRRNEILGIDFWRSGGTFALYDEESYVPLSDEQAAVLGGTGTPWQYYFPPGLVVVLGLLELGIMSTLRLELRTTLVVGATMMAVTILWLAKGLTYECIVPAGLALHHLLGSWIAVRQQRAEEAEVEALTPPAEEEPERERDGVRVEQPPARLDDDPFRGPPIKPPIVVERPRAPEARVIPNSKVDKPKLLK